MTDATDKLWRSLNWPNRISLMRLLLLPPFLLLLLHQDHWPWARHAALALFVVLAVSDFVDGLLARKLHLRTRLGAILDPLADKLLIISSVILLAVVGAGRGADAVRLPDWLVIAVVAKDLWVVIGFVVVYLVTDRFRVQPSGAGKASTLGQALLVAYTLAAPDIERFRPPAGTVGVLVGSWAVAGLSILAIISYTRLGLRFTEAEGKTLNNHAAENVSQRDTPDS